ncbi:MAG: class I SAM-dependent methyltransferase [Nitrospinaceae bacterium]
MRHSRILVAAILALTILTGCSGLKRAAYNGFNRDKWQQPDRVIQTLRIPPGAQIADLGAGGGYLTFRLAKATGPDGRVYAVDVDPAMTDFVQKSAREQGVQNVQTILAEPQDPKLPQRGIDLIFICNTYHHLKDRVAYLARLMKSLRPGGRIAILDFKQGRNSTPAKTIRAEMIQAGFNLDGKYDFLTKQNFQIFSAN